MLALLGSLGWGLLALGAITHIWHHQRLRELLGMHLDHERVPALLLTVAEAALALALPLAFITASAAMVSLAVAASVVAAGFVAWIARLLATGSALPCACSFSQAPTTWWSLGRAGCVVLVGAFAFASPDSSTATDVATLVTGLALAAAIFVLPEAVSWPPTSRALLARVDAYATSPDPDVIA